ncbi:hypothetical protein ABT160_10225 [Streptomyces sp. NPDC001941]|uniref:hypothetical protein n=1 Tax=Streptomyces sp. NPDC001941 TaxID=3154659 RepID=UPI00331E9E97
MSDSTGTTVANAVPPGALAGTARLQELLRALAEADPQAYFDAATALTEAAERIERLADLVQDRNERLFRANGGESWQGGAADTTEALATGLTARLRKLAPLIRPWAAEADTAGEAVNNAWHEVNGLLKSATQA